MKKVCIWMLVLVMVFTLVPAASANESDGKLYDRTKWEGRVWTTFGDQASKNPDSDVIRIGVLSYLTDAKATQRQYSQIGWESAAKIHMENGDLEGKKVEFVVFDPGNDGALDQQRLTELHDMGCVGLIHACGDGLTPASAQWAGDNKIPVIATPNASTVNTIQNYSPYFWNAGTKMAWSVGKLCAMDAVSRGYKTVAYVGKDGSACQDAITFIQFEGKKLDPDFTMIADYRVNDNDFTAVISAVMGLNPDFILEQGAGTTFVSFMQAAQQFDLPSVIPIYDDFAADSATGGPMVAAGTFPWGNIHGCVQFAYWLDEYKTGDLGKYIEMAYDSELASKMEFFSPVSGFSPYYASYSLLQAINDCIKAGTDYSDPEVLNTAISTTRWEDAMGEHFYRDFDNQLTNTLFFGTADTLNEKDQTPICSDIRAYSWQECMPSKADYKAYCEQIGFDHKGRFDD